MGDRIILVADNADYALSTNQKTNNRGAAEITRNGNQVTASADTQVLTVKAGTVDGTFAFYTGSGYLYAASSSKNYLKTQADLNENGCWSITIADGITSIVAQGSNARNVMQYNPNDGSPLFSCYDSAKMESLSIYRQDGDGSEDTEPTAPEEVTIAQALEIALEDNGKLYLVRGTITDIANTTWGNMYIADDSGNSLYVYGMYNADGSTRYDAMDPQPTTGDEVLLLGVLTLYNGNPQMKNGYVQEHKIGEKQDQEETPAEPVEVTIPEANAIGAAKNHNIYTTEKYIVTGVVTEITSESYGNMYIEDADGNRLYVYGVYSADGSTRYDAMDPQPAVGDTVTVLGVLGQYNGNPQMKNGWVTELVAGEGNDQPDQPDQPDTPVEPTFEEITIEEANAIGAAKEHNTYTEEKYIVTGVIVEIANDVWGNLYIEDAEGNRLYVYGLYTEDGSVRYDAMTTRPAVGDTITVLGVLGQYNDNPQMKNGWLMEHTPAGAPETGDPIMAVVCAMLLSSSAVAVITKKYSN